MMVPVLNNLGRVAYEQGQYEEARRIYFEALDISATDHLLPAAMDALVGLAEVLAGQGASEIVPEIISQVLNHSASRLDARDRASQLTAAWQLTGVIEKTFSTGPRSLDELVADLLPISPAR
jgi:hypothetical protein